MVTSRLRRAGCSEGGNCSSWEGWLYLGILSCLEQEIFRFWTRFIQMMHLNAHVNDGLCWIDLEIMYSDTTTVIIVADAKYARVSTSIPGIRDSNLWNGRAYTQYVDHNNIEMKDEVSDCLRE